MKAQITLPVYTLIVCDVDIHCRNILNGKNFETYFDSDNSVVLLNFFFLIKSIINQY